MGEPLKVERLLLRTNPLPSMFTDGTLVILLKVDMMSALGVLVTYPELDGD